MHHTLAALRNVLLLSALLVLSLPVSVGAQGVIVPPFPCIVPPLPLPQPEPRLPDRPVPLPQPLLPGTVDPSGATSSVAPDHRVIAPIEVIPPIEPIRPIHDCRLAIRYHRVNVEITGQVAITRVDQLFANETARDLEGSYLFPLPEDAAISSFSMFVDGEEIEGQVLTKEEARRLYESIVRRNRDPALLEFVGRGAFQARVFPVPAGGERRIELEYAQVLAQDGGLVRYVYPMTAAHVAANLPQQTSITVQATALRPITTIYSPSHDVTVARSGEHSATISWETGQKTERKDFALVYGVSPDPVGLHVLTHKPDGEDGYFLLLAAPSFQAASSRAVPKDVSLVFDTSGSMAGAKIDQAKEALRYIVNRLNPEDRFNIIAFSSTVNPFASGMQPLSERQRALAFIDGLVASGGTNISEALSTALKADTSGRLHTVVFVTDGLPTVGPQRPEQIVSNSKAAAGSAKPRLFSFGVGYDVNTTLLDTLASEFGGVSAYVKPNESLEEVISSFYDKIGSPVLTDLRLSLDGADVYDLFPTQLPDLYAGSQLVVVGRYRRAGTYDATLTGQHEGRALRFTAAGTDFSAAPVSGQASLPRLWASRKIGFLLSEIRLHGADPELVSEIVSLATRYGIATPYTSIFVPEPGTPGGTARPLVPGAVPGVVPGGFSGSGAGSAPLAAQGQAAAADALRQNLAAAPASGASAVQNAEQTRALKDATTVPATSTSTLRTIHGKSFVLVNGVWTDLSTGEAPPLQEGRMTIEFGTEAYFDLIEYRPDLAPYLSLGSRVLFHTGDLWIEIVETPLVP